jgi:hypothetical protein
MGPRQSAWRGLNLATLMPFSACVRPGAISTGSSGMLEKNRSCIDVLHQVSKAK